MTPEAQNGAQREYTARRDARAEHRAQMERREATISTLRLVVFVLGLVVVFVAWREAISAVWLLAPAAGFVALVFAHERASRRAARARRATAHYEVGLRRLDGTWPGTGVVRTDLAPDDHPYAADLDLFGRGSVFERLCLARTGAGVRTLADWLLAPAAVETLRARHEAVEELRNRVDLRESLAMAGAALEAEIDPDFLSEWGEQPPGVAPSKLGLARALAWGMALANVGAAVGWASGLSGFVLLATLVATWVAMRPFAEFAKHVMAGVERPRRELEVIAAVLRELETQSFTAPRLVALRAALNHGSSSAAVSIERLGRRVAWLEAKRSEIFAPVAFALMWSLHFGVAVDRWRCEHGPKIRSWFTALGELEALASLAGYAYERPDDTFPSYVEGPPQIEGERVGHPLLAADACVCNVVSLGQARQALVISGSNMSGKSTYLRTVGVAIVLAQAGAPVFAEHLRLSPLRVAATLRVQDSLQGGASRFFAEIKRLRCVMDVAEEGPGLFFLLDEILHGTNSHDRRIGAEAVVAKLLSKGAIGLVTTHDLALAQAAESMPAVVDNVHFSDTLVDGELVFDYQLKQGVVQTSNALDLMRAVGLDV